MGASEEEGRRGVASGGRGPGAGGDATPTGGTGRLPSDGAPPLRRGASPVPTTRPASVPGTGRKRRLLPPSPASAQSAGKPTRAVAVGRAAEPASAASAGAASAGAAPMDGAVVVKGAERARGRREPPAATSRRFLRA